MSKEAQEKVQKQKIGEKIYARMAFIPGIAEDKWAKVTGMLLESLELDDLQIIVKNQAALDVLIDKAHNAYNCLLEGKAVETPVQIAAAALAVAAAAQAAPAPPAKAPSPQHKQRQQRQRQRKLDPMEYPPLGKNAERAKGPAVAQAAAPPVQHRGKQWRQGPTRLQRAMTTAAMAVSTAAAIVSDFKSLPEYIGKTLGILWRFPKTRWFEQNLFEYAVKPFYGMLWGTCPTNDDSYRFLFFPEDEKAPDLKKKYSSFVVVTALHCIFNNTALDRLGIQCMFNDKNEIVEQIEVFMKAAIKSYIAEYHHNNITYGFKACVEYIRGHGNVKGAKNHDIIIEQRVTVVEKLFAEATTDKTEATIDELCNRLAELTSTVAGMAETQKQTTQRIGDIHAEVVVLQQTVDACRKETEACRKKIDEVADAFNRTSAMLARHDVPSPPMGCAPMPGCAPMLPMGGVPPTPRVDKV